MISTLHVLEGIALVGTRDGTVIRARAGETVACPAGVDHWYGAAPDTIAVHIAIVVAGSGHNGTDWLEPLTDQAYLTAATPAPSALPAGA